ncbi:MAG: nickel-type superoxide dismutase maturation protease [Nitriliruptorales bacterium]|nr:nickel-type superoxide dismutase maturation protease [Nitriliruptorales bacterium]
MPPRLRPVLVLVGLWLVALVTNRSLRRVTGDSMRPALHPGDVVVVVPRGVRLLRPGDVVVAADPREPSRRTVKRVAELTPDGVFVAGDNPAASTDSRTFGAVPAELVTKWVPARVWPPRRLALL